MVFVFVERGQPHASEQLLVTAKRMATVLNMFEAARLSGKELNRFVMLMLPRVFKKFSAIASVGSDLQRAWDRSCS